jgi:hypothetical protein
MKKKKSEKRKGQNYGIIKFTKQNPFLETRVCIANCDRTTFKSGVDEMPLFKFPDASHGNATSSCKENISSKA